MISDLKGFVARFGGDHLVLSVGGIGFEVRVTPRILETYSLGEEAHLYTRLIVKDDGWSLYGFEALEDRDFFDLLLTVKGIGPKLALGVLSGIRPEEFYNAIVTGDERALVGLPGIGKKTAARAIVELKDRIGAAMPHLQGQTAPVDEAQIEAREALVALGYTRSEAALAVRKASLDHSPLELETLLREALRILART